MKILHVIESLEQGGAEKVVVNLANHFQEQGHEIHVALTKRRGQLMEQLHEGISVHWLKGRPGDDPLVIPRLRRVIRSQGIDAVHAHNWNVLIESAAATTGTPARLVMTVHGPYPKARPGILPWIKRRARHMLEWLSAWRVSSIACVSDAAAEYTRKRLRGAPCRIITLNNSVPDHSGPCEHHTNERFRFISVGRLTPIKNYPMLFQALALILDQGADCELLLIGDGESRGELEALRSRLGLESRIEMPGFLNDVGAHLRCADAYVCSSNYEGISLAILEAMSAGLPILATDTGGNPELVSHGENGLLSPVGDAVTLAQHMLNICTDAERRQAMGRAARSRYQTRHAPTAFFRAHERLYGLRS